MAIPPRWLAAARIDDAAPSAGHFIPAKPTRPVFHSSPAGPEAWPVIEASLASIYGVNVPFMSFYVHEWDIHALSSDTGDAGVTQVPFLRFHSDRPAPRRTPPSTDATL